MSHEILGNRFYSRSKPAWHNLGTVFAADANVSASDAVSKVAGDVEVKSHKLFYANPEHYETAAMDTNSPPEFLPLDKFVAIIREPLHDSPQREVFGVTTDKWHKISYEDLARSLDVLSETYKVETAGLLLEGSLCFIAFRGPDFSVKGDECRDYFLANLSQKPGTAHKFLATPVRTVCWNTNQAAVSQSTVNLAIPHSANSGKRIELAANLVAKFKEITASNAEVFNRFAEIQITNANLTELIETAWPTPPAPTEVKLIQQVFGNGADEGTLKKHLGGANFAQVLKAQERHERSIAHVKELRNAGRESFESFNPANLRGTLWAGYNAVTEVADWREGRNADFGSIWGGRASEKTRAFGAALKLADSIG